MTIRLAGELVTCYLFSFRLSHSGKAVHRVFVSCGQEAFFEGHVHALRTLGGVPRTKVRYDNLKAAVARVLGLSRARVEADRWIAFKCGVLAGRYSYDLEVEPDPGDGFIRLTSSTLDASDTVLETSPSRYRPLAPRRILDTRSGVGAPRSKVGPWRRVA
ncbi:hypothetical protein AB0907_38925 [Streptomyces sp. NPDC006975]|uniref:hypothetical protein n=1 Tax=Streptomyces sp. NPDC006975 TaxID=3154310 RepID=UPI0034557E0B